MIVTVFPRPLRASLAGLIILASCVPKEGNLVSSVDLPAIPSVGTPAVWSPPAPQRLETAGGLPLYAQADHQLPLVSVRIQIPTGSVDDGSRWGVASLTTEMMEEAAGNLSSIDRSAAFDRLAAQFAVASGRDWSTVALDVHRDQLGEALVLLADSLLSPKFLPEDWERIQQQHVTGLEQEQDDNATVAADVAPRVLFGDDHPYGHPVSGTISSAKAVTLEDVKAFFSANFHSGGASVIVVGDVEPAAFKTLFDTAFKGWNVLPRPVRTIPAAKSRPGKFFVDSPESTQTVLRVSGPGPSGTDPNRDAADLARVVLGGSFTSRLNQRLREEKGYTYGARVGISRWSQVGMASASSNVRADATTPALIDLIEVLETARVKGYSTAEVDKARAQALAELVESSESRASLAGLYAMEIEQGRDPLTLPSAGAAVMAVDGPAMQAATERFLNPLPATILLVGDRAAVIADLEKAGFAGWTFLDKEGQPVK